MSNVQHSNEYGLIQMAVRSGEPVRIDGPARFLRKLASAVEQNLGVPTFLGDADGVPAYASQRSDGTSLFVPPPPAANYTGGAAVP